MEQWTKSDPEVVARLHSVVRAVDAFITEKPGATKKFFARLYPGTDPAALDLAHAKEWRNSIQPDFSLADVRRTSPC